MKVRGEGEQRIVRVWSSSLRVVDTMNLLYQLISLLHCHNFGERGTGNGEWLGAKLAGHRIQHFANASNASFKLF